MDSHICKCFFRTIAAPFADRTTKARYPITVSSIHLLRTRFLRASALCTCRATIQQHGICACFSFILTNYYTAASASLSTRNCLLSTVLVSPNPKRHITVSGRIFVANGSSSLHANNLYVNSHFPLIFRAFAGIFQFFLHCLHASMRKLRVSRGKCQGVSRANLLVPSAVFQARPP